MYLVEPLNPLNNQIRKGLFWHSQILISPLYVLNLPLPFYKSLVLVFLHHLRTSHKPECSHDF